MEIPGKGIPLIHINKCRARLVRSARKLFFIVFRSKLPRPFGVLFMKPDLKGNYEKHTLFFRSHFITGGSEFEIREMKKLDIESLIYKQPTNLAPGKGDLLIAEPLLNEPYFKRSVVLLLEEDAEQGHVGLTLNVPTPVTLSDIFPDWKDGKKVKVYCGGPVEADRLFMLHTLGDRFEGAMEVAEGLYVGANLDQVLEFIKEEDDVEGKIRFFLGYSGWGKDQLTTEILNHSWVVTRPGDMSEALTGKGDIYWRREVEKLGKDYRSWLVVPEEPMQN